MNKAEKTVIEDITMSLVKYMHDLAVAVSEKDCAVVDALWEEEKRSLARIFARLNP